MYIVQMFNNFCATKTFSVEGSVSNLLSERNSILGAGFGPVIICLMLETRPATFKGWLDFNQPSCHKCLMHFIFDKSWRSPDLRKQCNLFAGKQYVVLFPPAGRFLQGCTCRDQNCVAPL